MSATAILFYLLTLKQILYGSAQDCLRPANTEDSVQFDGNNMNPTIPNGGNGSQAIITSYQFHCCGDITEWHTYVQPGGSSRNGVYSINFQVWRPSPTVGSDGAGEYSLVGENRFTSLRFEDSSSIVSETPQPTNVLSVRPGDVVGYFQLSDLAENNVMNSNDGIQLAASYRNTRLMWYQTNAPQDTLSTLVAGSAGTLRSSTNAGPVLSVEIDSSSCTPLPTPPPTTPPTMPPITPPTTPPTTDITDPLTDVPTDPPTGNPPTNLPTGVQLPDPPITDPPITGPPIVDPSQTLTESSLPTIAPTTTSQSPDGGLVAILVIVLLILVITAGIIGAAVIVVRRYRRTKKLNLQTDQAHVNNPMYAAGNDAMPMDTLSPHNDTTHYESFPEGIPSEYQQYYSAVGASTDETAEQATERYEMQQQSVEYADPNPCNGGVYEELTIDTENCHETSTSSEKEDIYMIPGSDENTLYSQLADIVTDNVSRSTVRLGDFLGSGQFGTVYKGVWQSSTRGAVEVAVKTLNEGSKKEDRIKFLQEAAIMGQFKHPNVVEMYGVITDREPILLVLEILMKGDLRDYLLKVRSEKKSTVDRVAMDDHTLLSYCCQVASGMAYLSSKAFVHRDLAARNVLVSDDNICKIADFGMSRDLMDESYYIAQGGMIPVKWTAPEALHYKKYSTTSDVWSYGALMYEIWSVGHKPFENLSNSEVIRKVGTGYRLPPPPGCPRALYNIMIQCWHPETVKRPSFKTISSQLSSLPEAELLKWTEKDRSIYPDADKLGADLDCAQDLYPDLQTLYKRI